MGLPALVFLLDVRFALVGGVMSDGYFGDIGWEKAAKVAENLDSWLYGRNGAEANELIAVEADAAIHIFEELLRRRDEASFAAPNILEEWRDDAIVHMASEDEIERRENVFYGAVIEMDRGVSKEEFGLFRGELCKLVFN